MVERMRRTPTWTSQILLFALLIAAGVAVVRTLAGGRHGNYRLPVIGGDTWPPVPVKIDASN